MPCRLYLHADFKRLFFRWQRVRGGVVMPALLSTKEAAAHLFGEATRKTEQIVRRMEREMVLLTARDLITGDRAKAYGNAKDNLQRTATMWGVVLGIEVTPRQVADCMIALKLARNVNETSFDSYVDVCGYAAIGWECSDGD